MPKPILSPRLWSSPGPRSRCRRCEECEEGEEPRKPFLMCACIKEYMVPPRQLPLSAFSRKRTASATSHIFVVMPNYGRNQHPEERAGAAEVQGRRYACDIAGSDRRRESGGESREGRKSILDLPSSCEISENFLNMRPKYRICGRPRIRERYTPVRREASASRVPRRCR
jgi:hypothetical protein